MRRKPTEDNTRKESANPKDVSKSGEKAKITKILADREKFQVHIQEIDDALINDHATSSVIKAVTIETAENTLTEVRSSGPAVEIKLDQDPNTMGFSGNGPSGLIINNPTPRTWKRVTHGLKTTNPYSEDSHAGYKRGAQDHANNDMGTKAKKKKMETKVVEVTLRWKHGERQRNRSGKPFRFEAMWLRDPRCAEVVTDAWEFGLGVPTGHPLQNCIASCNAYLTQWNKKEFGHVVATLIDYQRGEWDMEALQCTLMAKDVKSALSIALSPSLPEDRLIWALNSSRKFTMKSTYRLALDERAGHVAEESSNSTRMKEFWNFIWRLNVPNKIRNFTWRACRNILPTKANLSPEDNSRHYLRELDFRDKQPLDEREIDSDDAKISFNPHSLSPQSRSPSVLSRDLLQS
nr:hypothetical protein CFP56_13905 [Quercus suber]